MAAEWTDMVQRRAFDVETRCVRAHRVLADAAAYLAPPMLAAEAQAARGRVQVALAIVSSAQDELGRAANAATAATVLALRGAAADVTVPLRSVDHVPDAYRDARLALGLLRTARDLAVAACNSAGRCRGRLQTASRLINASDVLAAGLPGVDGCLETQLSVATVHLEAMLAFSSASAALVVVANWMLDRACGGVVNYEVK